MVSPSGQEKMLLTKSLQPTGCHEYPLERLTPKLGAFARPTAATSVALPLEPSPELPRAVIHGDGGWPLPASPHPGWQHSWRCATSCGQHHRPERWLGVPSSWPERAFSALPVPGELAHKHLLSLARRLTRHPGCDSNEPGSSPHDARQGESRVVDPRHLPPSGPARTPPACAVSIVRGPPPVSPTDWPETRLPTGFHARPRRALDPGPLPALAGAPGPPAAYRLLQQSVPRTHPRAFQAPVSRATANRRSTEWSRS